MSTKLDKELDEEVLEHVILEKKGVLKGNHFLPKKKPKKESSDFWFYTIWLTIIGAELWYLYLYAMMKISNLY